MEFRDEYSIIIGILCLISTLAFTVSTLSVRWFIDCDSPVQSCFMSEMNSVSSFDCTPRKSITLKDTSTSSSVVLDIIENGVFGEDSKEI